MKNQDTQEQQHFQTTYKVEILKTLPSTKEWPKVGQMSHKEYIF